MKLAKEFFERDPIKVAKELLGKKLSVSYRNNKLEGLIVATSAYKDSPKRNLKCLYTEAGEISIPTISGYKKLVIGTQTKDIPSVITIDKILTKNKVLSSGKICDYFYLDKDYNGIYVFSNKIWIEGEKGKFSILEHMKNASYNCVKRYQMRI